MTTPRLLAGLLALAVAVAAARPAAALDKPSGFPDQPLTLIVPRGSGGGSHQLATRIAAELEKVIGQPVRIVHKPADGGREAIRHFLSLPPDGYHVLQHVDDVASLYARGEIDVDPTSDLVPLAIAQITFSQIYVQNLERRFHDLDTFVEYARQNPGEVKVALVGHHGAMESVLLEILAGTLGLEFVELPFNDPAERYLSLIRGDADALIEQPGDVRPFLDRQLIKPILTLLPERATGFEQIASLGDLRPGFPKLMRFRGFFAPGELSAERRLYLEEAFHQAYETESFKRFNREKYMDQLGGYRDTQGAIELIREIEEVYRALDAE